jgi:hypothetical protein
VAVHCCEVKLYIRLGTKSWLEQFCTQYLVSFITWTRVIVLAGVGMNICVSVRVLACTQLSVALTLPSDEPSPLNVLYFGYFNSANRWWSELLRRSARLNYDLYATTFSRYNPFNGWLYALIATSHPCPSEKKIIWPFCSQAKIFWGTFLRLWPFQQRCSVKLYTSAIFEHN